MAAISCLIVASNKVYAGSPRWELRTALCDVARQAFDEGDYDNTILAYTEVLKLYPRLPWVRTRLAEAYATRGSSRYAQGDSAGRARDYAQAKRIDPQYWERVYSQRSAVSGQLPANSPVYSAR